MRHFSKFHCYMICSVTEHSKIAISILLPGCNCFLTQPASCKTSSQYVEDLQLKKLPQEKSSKSKHITKLLQLRNYTNKSITSQKQQQQQRDPKDYNKIVISTILKFWTWKKEQTKLIFILSEIESAATVLRCKLQFSFLVEVGSLFTAAPWLRRKKHVQNNCKGKKEAEEEEESTWSHLVCALIAGFSAMIKTEVSKETDHQHAISRRLNFTTLLLLYYHCRMRKSGSAKSATTA